MGVVMSSAEDLPRGMDATPMPMNLRHQTITDQTCVDLCAGLYGGAPAEAGLYAGASSAWDVYDPGDVHGICYGIKRIEDIDVVVLRGSITFTDWQRDFAAFPTSRPSPLGPLHYGFSIGMERAWATIKPQVGAKVVVTGHSLGAARAAILTGLMVLDSRPPIRRVVFGEPKAGFQPLADIVGKVPGASYSNGDGKHHDLVVDVPFSFPPDNYVRPTPLVFVTAQPTGSIWERFGPFAFHHISLYQQGVADFLANPGAKV